MGLGALCILLGVLCQFLSSSLQEPPPAGLPHSKGIDKTAKETEREGRTLPREYLSCADKTTDKSLNNAAAIKI